MNNDIPELEMNQNEQPTRTEGFNMGVQHFLNECLGCGKCMEVCPVYSEPRFELLNKSPKAVIGKVVELLKEGSVSAEAYKIVYGCAKGCSNICGSACPKGLDLQVAFVAAGQRLRAEGEGVPPLAYHHMFGQRYGFSHVFGDLQMKGDETPWLKEAPSEPEPVDVVLFLGCLGLGFPHVVLETMDILRKMDMNFVTLGARDLCCGSMALFFNNMEETYRMSENFISTIGKFGAKKVLTICDTCAAFASDVLPMFFSVPFETVYVTEFLAENRERLSFKRPIEKVVAIHDACSQRKRGRWDAPRELLRTISGIRVVEMEHNKENNLCCRAMTNTCFPGVMDAVNFVRLDEAKTAGADVMATNCLACQLVLCPYEKHYPIEIKHIISIVAEAMDIHHEDKLKKYLLTGDTEKVLHGARDYVEYSDLSLMEFKNILPTYFERLCAKEHQ